MNFCYKLKFLLLRKIESERVKSNQSCNFPSILPLTLLEWIIFSSYFEQSN